MSSPTPREPLLTLEPLLDALREGVESGGWSLSGLQKTTSYEFEGRWSGQSTRSAYVFFHHEDHWAGASVELYLDETSRGLKCDVQLVVDGPSLGALGDPEAALVGVAEAASDSLPEGYALPLTLRVRLDRAGDAPSAAAVEWRVKLRLPRATMGAGHAAVAALTAASVRGFEALLDHPGFRVHAQPD